jgi:membrane protease YdiL (CAAX protease family)
MDQRLRAPWHPLEAVPIVIVAAVVTLLLVVILRLLIAGGGSLFTVTALVIQQVALGLTTLMWVRVRYRDSLPALGLHSRRGLTDGLIGVLAGLGLLAVGGFVVFPIESFVWEAIAGNPPPAVEQLPFEFTTPVIVTAAILVVGITPVAEEIFFRGFVFGGLRGRLSFLPSAAIASAAFALLHPPLQLGIVIFFVGLGFAALYEWRGSLFVNIAAHMAFNLIGYTVIVMNRT